LRLKNENATQTDTTAPMSHQLLDSNRTNARSTPNKPTTWINETATSAGGILTVAGTSGIKCKSRVECALTSGGATIYESPWKYDGFLDPWQAADFTLPVTAHSHTISESNINAGVPLWCRLHGIDPVGRDFWSAWVSLASAAGAGPDSTITSGDTFGVTGSSASYYASLVWTTTGDGVFNNNALLHPVYTPGAADRGAGTVNLLLTAVGYGGGGDIADLMTLTITPLAGGVKHFQIPSLGMQ